MPGFVVTRGLGPNAKVTNLIARGFLPEIEEVLRKHGASYSKTKRKRYDQKTKEYYDEYNIYVELTSVNGKDLFDPIINRVKHRVNEKDISLTVRPTKLTVQSPNIKINVQVVEKK